MTRVLAVTMRGEVRKLRDDEQNGEVRRSEDDKEIGGCGETWDSRTMRRYEVARSARMGRFEDDDGILGSEGMLMLIGSANGVDSGDCVVIHIHFDHWRSGGSNRWRVGARANESLRSLKAWSQAGDQVRCTFLRDG